MKSFGNWDTQDIHLTFGIQELDNLPDMEVWATHTEDIPEKIAGDLELLRKELLLLNEDWNEDELKMNFIAPFLHLIHYRQRDTYNIFYQRTLSATVNEIEMGGIIDMEIAKGWKKPIKPYFFLHEYKQEQGGKGDARGQLLAAMITAQALNQDEKPIFGAYLVAASWRFVILKEKSYTVLRLDATKKEDLTKIYAMLCWIKKWIHKELNIT